jgi:hypothetical protein
MLVDKELKKDMFLQNDFNQIVKTIYQIIMNDSMKVYAYTFLGFLKDEVDYIEFYISLIEATHKQNPSNLMLKCINFEFYPVEKYLSVFNPSVDQYKYFFDYYQRNVISDQDIEKIINYFNQLIINDGYKETNTTIRYMEALKFINNNYFELFLNNIIDNSTIPNNKYKFELFVNLVNQNIVAYEKDQEKFTKTIRLICYIGEKTRIDNYQFILPIIMMDKMKPEYNYDLYLKLINIVINLSQTPYTLLKAPSVKNNRELYLYVLKTIAEYKVDSYQEFQDRDLHKDEENNLNIMQGMAISKSAYNYYVDGYFNNYPEIKRKALENIVKEESKAFVLLSYNDIDKNEYPDLYQQAINSVLEGGFGLRLLKGGIIQKNSEEAKSIILNNVDDCKKYSSIKDFITDEETNNIVINNILNKKLEDIENKDLDHKYSNEEVFNIILNQNNETSCCLDLIKTGILNENQYPQFMNMAIKNIIKYNNALKSALYGENVTSNNNPRTFNLLINEVLRNKEDIIYNIESLFAKNIINKNNIEIFDRCLFILLEKDPKYIFENGLINKNEEYDKFMLVVSNVINSNLPTQTKLNSYNIILNYKLLNPEVELEKKYIKAIISQYTNGREISTLRQYALSEKVTDDLAFDIYNKVKYDNKHYNLFVDTVDNELKSMFINYFNNDIQTGKISTDIAWKNIFKAFSKDRYFYGMVENVYGDYRGHEKTENTKITLNELNKKTIPLLAQKTKEDFFKLIDLKNQAIPENNDIITESANKLIILQKNEIISLNNSEKITLIKECINDNKSIKKHIGKDLEDIVSKFGKNNFFSFLTTRYFINNDSLYEVLILLNQNKDQEKLNWFLFNNLGNKLIDLEKILNIRKQAIASGDLNIGNFKGVNGLFPDTYDGIMEYEASKKLPYLDEKLLPFASLIAKNGNRSWNIISWNIIGNFLNELKIAETQTIPYDLYTNSQPFVFEILKKDNPLGTVLGDLTGCCQKIDGEGKSCIIDGYNNPDSGFLAIYNRKKLVAQAWLRYSRTMNSLVLDNIEAVNVYDSNFYQIDSEFSYGPSLEFSDMIFERIKNTVNENNNNNENINKKREQLSQAIVEWAKYIKQKLNLKEVAVGTGYIDVKFNSSEIELKPIDVQEYFPETYNLYTDIKSSRDNIKLAFNYKKINRRYYII